MNICNTCQYFTPDKDQIPFGHCANENWRQGYNIEIKDLNVNQVLVEDDEGWSALMGPEFGCIHWSKKE